MFTANCSHLLYPQRTRRTRQALTSQSAFVSELCVRRLPRPGRGISALKIAPSCPRPKQIRLSDCQLSAVSCQPLFSFSTSAAGAPCATALKSPVALSLFVTIAAVLFTSTMPVPAAGAQEKNPPMPMNQQMHHHGDIPL